MDANPFTREGAALLLGERGEAAVAKVLRSMGLRVDEVGGQSFDLLLVDRVTVEVKTALPTPTSNGSGKRWQFMLHKRSRGRPLEEHVLVLRCQWWIDEHSPVWHYVIPGYSLGLAKLSKIDITSHPARYNGKWSMFLEAWPLARALAIQAITERWPDPRNEGIPF